MVLAGIFCYPVTGAQPVPDYGKILQIHLDYHDTIYTVSSLEVRYGRAPNLDITSGNLKGVILDSNGNVLKSFSFQEPGTTYGVISGPPGENNLIGFTKTSSPGEMPVTLPYLPDMQTFIVSDSRAGSRLVSVDLNPTVALFCNGYPNDPDCLARVSPSQSAGSYPGNVLLLTVLLSALAIITAGTGIWIIRSRITMQTPAKNVVLIVDDEPDVVNFITSVLDKKGYTTLNADSGISCLDVLKKKIPDLILLDVRMEPMDGWQTLEHIKKNPDFKSIPVLMLTSNKLTAEIAKQYNICIDDYITKPFDLESLYRAIDSTLMRKRNLKESLVLAKKAGIGKEKFCEFAILTRRISVNRKILDILDISQGLPDDMQVVDYINVKTRDHEKRAEQLRQEINSAFRLKGLPELSW